MRRILLQIIVVSFMLAASAMLASCNDDSSSATQTAAPAEESSTVISYPIVSTNQTKFFDNTGEIAAPAEGQPFYGQDAQYQGKGPEYIDNGDGTITDEVTGLMWQKSVAYMSWPDARANAANANTGGYTDWRVPTIKELYSLIEFTGNQGTGNPSSSTPPSDARPFIDTDYFDFAYPTSGRYIDVQFISSTVNTAAAINNPDTFFGLNLADGRIKAYPQSGNVSNREFPARFVRANPDYGNNRFVDNGDGTITDNASGLMWSQVDSGDPAFAGDVAGYTYADGTMNWQEALSFSENADYAGYGDWRLPDAKELQSIVDYSRSPDATDSPAIDPLFSTTAITNEAGQPDYPAFWSSTTFEPGRDAVIIFFGRAMGYFDANDPVGNSNPAFLDVHGAGCQRTDPKTGDPTYGFGPQGDVRRVYNYVRLVRNP